MNKLGEYGLGNNFESPFSGEIKERIIQKRVITESINLHKHTLNNLNATQLLTSSESFIPKNLIDLQTFAKIKILSSYFPGEITSFFGFETNLTSSHTQADYLFAVSSRKGEREAFLKMLINEKFSDQFMNQDEWQHIREFTTQWTDANSKLFDKILGLWLEFDMIGFSSKAPVPCVFIQIPTLRIDSPEDLKELTWLTTSVLPLLTGRCISERMQDNMKRALQLLPEGSGLMDIGMMLSRKVDGVRFCIVKITPEQILPYLTSLGWSDKNNHISTLLKELEQWVNRLVLHINITEDGVDPKIGLECSFSPTRYHLETRWSAFLDSLIKKEICLPEKKESLIRFPGVEQEDSRKEFNPDRYQVSVKIQDDNVPKALVRFISHIKLVYTPNSPIQAKAYSGVRLLGLTPINKTSN